MVDTSITSSGLLTAQAYSSACPSQFSTQQWSDLFEICQMTDFSAQNPALTLRIQYNIFTSMESPALSRPGATPQPCQLLPSFPASFFLVALLQPHWHLLFHLYACCCLPRTFFPGLLACYIFLLSTVTAWQSSCLSPPPPHSRASALSPLPLMVWYPIQFCYPCLWENLWACSFLSILEATASNTPSRSTQLTRPFCPSHLSCPVLPSGGSRRPDTPRPLPKPRGIALNRISVNFDCLQGGFRDANFICLGLGVGERLSVLYKTHPP